MKESNQQLQETLKNEKELIFYKIMHYPVPKQFAYFLRNEKIAPKAKKPIRIGDFKDEWFSRKKKNPYMEEYSTHIQKFRRIYRNIPFVQSLYLCNSITFNALHEDSDIDILIITKKRALRRARLASEIYFRLLFLKRGKTNKRKKFCLSFYTSQEYQNFYNIMLPQNDIYFIYRLAHLVPLYQESYENIYKHNQRIKSTLPNFPGKQCINIWISSEFWKSNRKKIQEFFLWWIRGTLLEKTIKYLRLPLVIYKKNKVWERGRGIIINDHMLKFHQDKRKKIHLLYKIYTKKYQERQLLKK